MPFGVGSVMVWGCVSHDCKLDLITINGKLTGEKYIKDMFAPVVLPHFDNHTLESRPLFLDDNARPHRSRAVRAFLRMNPSTLSQFDKRIQALKPPPQTLQQLLTYTEIGDRKRVNKSDV